MNNKNYDYFIVGQGIAGTLLAYRLINLGKSVLVIDDKWTYSSSTVAAGIINPITGKNFVLSWRYRDFNPVAMSTYVELGEKLGGKYLIHQPIIRTLDSIEGENAWSTKAIDPLFDDLIAKEADNSEWKKISKHNGAFAEIKSGCRIDFMQLLKDFKHYLCENNSYFEACFTYESLDFSNKDYIKYGDFSAKEVVFCEGVKAINNPYFIDHKLSGTKGEVLIIKCPGLRASKMYKKKFFIIPLGDDYFWVGAGYQWNTIDHSPTSQGKEEIIERLTDMLDMPPYEVIEHKAAIRPTVQTRRPIMKTSHIDPRIHMLNGLGTKGALIAPFVTQQFAEYLMSKDEKFLLL